MLKNKSLMVTICFILFLSLICPIVRSENETKDMTANELTVETTHLINEDPEATTNTNQSSLTDENLKKGDVYLSGDHVTVDYIVDGNLFIIANTVTINSQIGGDAFICANTVNIGESGYIFSNLFTVAKHVTINGLVYDLYSISQITTITGAVYRDIRINANIVHLSGTIGRNAFIKCANLNFPQSTHELDEEKTKTTSSCQITGDLHYTAIQEASIPEGTVKGEIQFTSKDLSHGNYLQKNMISIASLVIIVVIIWLISLWIAPKFFKNITSLITTKKLILTIGLGILAPIVIFLISILFLMFKLTFSFGLLLLLTLFIFMAISTSIFIMAINHVICHQLKIQKTIAVFGMLIISTITLSLLALIPYVGSFIRIIALVLGLGMLIGHFVFKDTCKTETIN